MKYARLSADHHLLEAIKVPKVIDYAHKILDLSQSNCISSGLLSFITARDYSLHKMICFSAGKYPSIFSAALICSAIVAESKRALSTVYS
jgi:hypothetical protein